MRSDINFFHGVVDFQVFLMFLRRFMIDLGGCSAPIVMWQDLFHQVVDGSGRLGNLNDGRPQDMCLHGFLYLIGDTLLMQKYPLLNGDLVFTERNGPRVMRTPHITNPKLRPALFFMGRGGAFVMWEHFWKRINLFYDQELHHITQGGF